MFKTKADLLVELLETKKQVQLSDLHKFLDASEEITLAFAQYLQEAGVLSIQFRPRPVLVFLKSPESKIEYRDEIEVVNKLKILLEENNLKGANNMLYHIYFLSKKMNDERLSAIYTRAHEFFIEYLKKNQIIDFSNKKEQEKLSQLIKEIDSYQIQLEKFVMHARIVKQEFELVPYYILNIVEYSAATEVVLNRVKDEVIRSISLSNLESGKYENEKIRAEFRSKLIAKLHFLLPDVPEARINALGEYITTTTVGMGEIEIILNDSQIEEIVINSSDEPIWVYHKKYAWLKTNIIVEDEDIIKHYATLAGRLVNKNITLLSPLLDAHLNTGDRLNATLEPISTRGNTVTIRKFATKPWTINSLIANKTMDVHTAALIWMAIEYELSVLIVGGTGSGKTSTLNVLSQFFPPNQRIISIEDTRELTLPNTLHWVPLATRLANPEGQGQITMLDLVVNSLRMRPDRIIVGEIRRKAEAEVLFEAMHTGHSVYATLHANSVNEAYVRLTNAPIEIPKVLLNSLSLIIVQNRNRRTGLRRTFQVAEMLENGEPNLLYEYDFSKDTMRAVNKSVRIFETLKMFSGLSRSEIEGQIAEKIKILDHIVDRKIDDVHEIGVLIADYYANKGYLLNRVNKMKKTDKVKVNDKLPSPSSELDEGPSEKVDFDSNKI